jgi:hypothetical protein
MGEIMKLRIIFRKSIDDAEGHCVEYKFYTCEIEIPDNLFPIWMNTQNVDNRPEVIGCEWL